ncbi:HEPN domain-containing protein [candidate division KSB1 bacterium]|nr:HEPN domain-containing protein [candidate division KSB1 bacterium]
MDIDKFKKFSGDLLEQSMPFKITGMVAFGSRVKEDYTEDSDTDLLVVASGIAAKRQRRGREIAILKKLLPPMPLDILLLTKKETISNFKNHNPLFLDIATEGIVILDSDEFLANVIEETRNYLYNSKIQKIKDGWIFPVKAGVPTYLSKVSNEDFSKAMLKDGERDFEIGQKLKDEAYFDKSVYHFQQAVEKFIKAIMIAMGVFKKTHFIGEELIALIDKGEIPLQWKEQLLEAAQLSEEIEPEVSLSRYPGISDDGLWLPYEEYEELDATNALKKAEKVRLTANNFISEWFGYKGDKPPIDKE